MMAGGESVLKLLDEDAGLLNNFCYPTLLGVSGLLNNPGS